MSKVAKSKSDSSNESNENKYKLLSITTNYSLLTIEVTHNGYLDVNSFELNDFIVQMNYSRSGRGGTTLFVMNGPASLVQFVNWINANYLQNIADL